MERGGLMKSIIPACVLLTGCNPVQKIAVTSNAIREEAKALIEHGVEVGDAFVIDRAAKIDALAAGVHTLLPNVDNKVPEWMSLLQWGLIAVIAIAVVILLWQTGIGSAIKAVLGWIPRKTKDEARLAASVLSEEKPENVREWIAVKRTDPEWNRAFEQAQKEIK
jgi:hypothetical protein